MNSPGNILVTGAAGYIGSHACKALKNRGFNPVAIDNLSTGWSDAVKFGPFEKVDLMNQEELKKVFEIYKPEAVMHFAALSQVGESVIYPGNYWRNNVLGSLNLIETAISHKCFNFVFSSTCAIYGDHDGVLLKENTPQIPKNSYGASKRAVEEMIRHFSVSAGLKYVIFRYFNVAGADPDAEIGELHKPETHLIPLILDTILGKRDSISINELQGQEIVQREVGSTTRNAVEIAMKENQVSTKPILEIGSREGIWKAVEQGLGLGFVADFEFIDHPDLKVVPISDAKIKTRYFLAYLKERRHSKFIQAFCKISRSKML